MQLEEDIKLWGETYFRGEVFILFSAYHCMFFRPAPTYLVLDSVILMKKIEKSESLLTVPCLSCDDSLGVQWTWGGKIRIQNGNHNLIKDNCKIVLSHELVDNWASWESNCKVPQLFMKIVVFGFLRKNLMTLESSERSSLNETGAFDLF